MPVKQLEQNGCTVICLQMDGGTPAKRLPRYIPRLDCIIAGLENDSHELIRKRTKLMAISQFGVGYNNKESVARD